MSQRAQQDAINAARAHLDDPYDGKTVFQFSPLQGIQDGTNKTFQIPQTRVVVNLVIVPNVFPQVYKNGPPLVFNTDYTVPNPKQGVIIFTTAPLVEDSLVVTFSWAWMDDIELDHHLNRGANEIGFTTYYTSGPTIASTEQVPTGGSLPTDIPDGLYNAILLFGCSNAASAVANRYAMKYDMGAGDQHFSPSQIAKAFTDLATTLKKNAIFARDNFYQAQGRQFFPSLDQTGFVLPDISPSR